MTFRIVERLTCKLKNLLGIRSPSRVFFGPPEDINAIPEKLPAHNAEKYQRCPTGVESILFSVFLKKITPVSAPVLRKSTRQ